MVSCHAVEKTEEARSATQLGNSAVLTTFWCYCLYAWTPLISKLAQKQRWQQLMPSVCTCEFLSPLKPPGHNSPQLCLAANASALTPPSIPTKQALTARASQEGIQGTVGCCSFPNSCCSHAKEIQGESHQLETRNYLSSTKHPQLGSGKKARLWHSQLVTRGERNLLLPSPADSPSSCWTLCHQRQDTASTCATLLLQQGVTEAPGSCHETRG